LISSGHDPDHLLSTYSWAQLGIFARCVVRSRVSLLNALIGPVVGTQGAEWTGHRVADAPTPTKKQKPSAKPDNPRHRKFKLSEAGDDDDARERAFLARLRGLSTRLG
jgi:hypothetical protein